MTFWAKRWDIKWVSGQTWGGRWSSKPKVFLDLLNQMVHLDLRVVLLAGVIGRQTRTLCITTAGSNYSWLFIFFCCSFYYMTNSEWMTHYVFRLKSTFMQKIFSWRATRRYKKMCFWMIKIRFRVDWWSFLKETGFFGVFFSGCFDEMINGLEKSLEILLGKIASETWIPARFEPSTTTEVEPWLCTEWPASHYSLTLPS